jgi:putative membrane protein
MNVTSYLVSLPNFAAYLVASVALTAIFLVIYTAITPAREWTLLRAGNSAAAISLAGATLGFVLPLASVIVHSLNVTDMIVWGIVALLVQLLAYLVVRVIEPRIKADIDADHPGPAVFLAAVSLGFGILNAACITP